ncbi:MAG: hypothetical protein GY715_22180 [Planctomycetes bacterium]|nr:hypothetical protein [Planctomycetota bacterium]
MYRSIRLSAVLAASLSVPVAAADLSNQVDHRRFQGLEVGAAVDIASFELAAGRTVDLLLERFDVFAPGAKVVVGGPDGDREIALPDVVLLRGEVAGEPGSRVFIGVAPHGVHGSIRRADTTYFISTGRHDGERELAVTDARDLPVPAGELPGCAVEADDDFYFPLGRPAPAGAATDGPFPIGPCRIARVAIESDWEFTGNLFGGDFVASAAYAALLFGSLSDIYIENLNTRLLVSFLRVWPSDIDPYDAGTSSAALNAFRSYWAANEGDVEREIAHYVSGRNLGGGVAWVGVVCSESNGYGVSGNLNGSYPYPAQDHQSGNWDPYVTAHEIGHNFGTGHTHSYNPPIDGCGNDDCSQAYGGTIMSYCHLCPGGVSNIVLDFHPTVRDQILSYLDGACDITASGVTGLADTIYTFENVVTTLDVLANDEDASCDPVVIDTVDAVGEHGRGTITVLPAGGGFPRDRLVFTPTDDGPYSDRFHYTPLGGEPTLVRVVGRDLRDAAVTGPVETGAEVSYYALSSPSVLPDFDTLTPYDTDVVTDIDFPSTGGNFATSGRGDQVGAVFEGYVTVPENGVYTFFTDSDDGSALYVGGDHVVANDGLHGMVERSGAMGLEAGAHPIRVEFFENGGGAGLIVSYQGPGVSKQPIPATAWSYADPCAFDLDASGAIDFGDVLQIVAQWGPCGPSCPADLNGDGEVGFGDILAVIGVWGPCS